MSTYAVVDSGVVVNVIVADSLEVAEEVTQRDCIPCDEYTEIGFMWSSEFDAYIRPQPQDCGSFLYNPVTRRWEPPVPYPNDPDKVFVWVEHLWSWVEVPGATPLPDDYQSYLRWNPETEGYDEMDEVQEPGPFSWPNRGV